MKYHLPEPRTGRAPLGNKTTNAKARSTQQGVKDIVRTLDQTQQTVKPTTSKKQKQSAPQIEAPKLEVHIDADPLSADEEDVELAPPRLKDIPYESDILPEGTLTFKGLQKDNMFKGYYQHYYNPVDDNGVSLKDYAMQEEQQKAFQRGDEQILKDMEEFDWSTADAPQTEAAPKQERIQAKLAGGKTLASGARAGQAPISTLRSRQAASALSMAAKSTSTIPAKTAKPPVTNKGRLLPILGRTVVPKSLVPVQSGPAHERKSAEVVSRTTLGYQKGRSALAALQPGVKAPKQSLSAQNATSRSFQRSVSTASSGSDATITPARFAQRQGPKTNELKRPEFLSIFSAGDEDENELGGSLNHVDSDDEFQLSFNI